MTYADILFRSLTYYARRATRGDQRISQVWLAERCYFTTGQTCLDIVTGNKKKYRIVQLFGRIEGEEEIVSGEIIFFMLKNNF